MFILLISYRLPFWWTLPFDCSCKRTGSWCLSGNRWKAKKQIKSVLNPSKSHLILDSRLWFSGLTLDFVTYYPSSPKNLMMNLGLGELAKSSLMSAGKSSKPTISAGQKRLPHLVQTKDPGLNSAVAILQYLLKNLELPTSKIWRKTTTRKLPTRIVLLTCWSNRAAFRSKSQYFFRKRHFLAVTMRNFLARNARFWWLLSAENRSVSVVFQLAP